MVEGLSRGFSTTSPADNSMSRTVEELHKVIANLLNANAPKDWEKIIAAADIGDDTGEVLYDYVGASGVKNWFAPDTRVQYEIYTAFQEMRSTMKSAGHAWIKARFTLERPGKVHVDFDYG
jgi:hypothetical protein